AVRHLFADELPARSAAHGHGRGDALCPRSHRGLLEAWLVRGAWRGPWAWHGDEAAVPGLCPAGVRLGALAGAPRARQTAAPRLASDGARLRHRTGPSLVWSPPARAPLAGFEPLLQIRRPGNAGRVPFCRIPFVLSACAALTVGTGGE